MEHNIEKDWQDPEDFSVNSCSATDCTGLIPALPQNEDEVASYEELYHFLPKASASSKE